MVANTDPPTYLPTKVIRVEDYVKEKVTHVKIYIVGFEPEAV
jgi:hypothetical protein